MSPTLKAWLGSEDAAGTESQEHATKRNQVALALHRRGHWRVFMHRDSDVILGRRLHGPRTSRLLCIAIIFIFLRPSTLWLMCSIYPLLFLNGDSGSGAFRICVRSLVL